MNAAGTRSWSLTAPAFWSTLGFNVVLYFAMAALWGLAYVIGIEVIDRIGQLLAASVLQGRMAMGEFLGIYDAIVGLFICVYVMAVSFGFQAHAIAQLYWLRALERRVSALAAAAPATA